MKSLCKILLLWGLTAALPAAAQPDTLALAQQLAWSKAFAEANQLLAVYNQHHRQPDALRLQAQVLHWMGRSRQALALLEPARQEFPAHAALQEDQARILFESGRVQKARAAYAGILARDSLHAEALLNTAFINRWDGKTGAARRGTESFLQHYPKNQQAQDLRTVMQQESTPWLRLGFGYLSDDQPLQIPQATLEAGWYKSWALAPQLLLRWNNMQGQQTNSSALAQLANTFYIGATGTTLVAGAGLIMQNGNQEATAKIQLSQKLARHLHFDAGWEKRPYQHTDISTRSILMQQFTQLSLRYNKNDTWLAQASMEQQRFDDGHAVNTIYAWGMLPVVQAKGWRLSTGYSFAWADADTNTYRPTKTLPQIIASGGTIAGVYDPYFTPTNQITHSLLLSARVDLSKAVQWQLRASAAFAGKADNPYFYLVRNNGNQFSLVRAFYQEDYYPVDIYTVLQWKAGAQSTLQLYYQYSRLLFYNRHQTGITFKFPLYHAGR